MIKKIIIEINKKEHKISLDEAKKLHKDLDEMFGTGLTYIPYYPLYPYKPYPYYHTPLRWEWTDCDSVTGGSAIPSFPLSGNDISFGNTTAIN